MNALDILRAGRALITDEAHWTRDAFARLGSGKPTIYQDPMAVSFCTAGAILRVGDSVVEVDEASKYLVSGFGVQDQGSVMERNDQSTHAEVLAAWDRAIALAEEQEFGAPLPPVETPEPVLALA